MVDPNRLVVLYSPGGSNRRLRIASSLIGSSLKCWMRGNRSRMVRYKRSVHEVRHDVFQEPDDPDITIWRYMDVAKLMSLLSSSTLWFSRADRLGDPHEGSLGSASRRALLDIQDRFMSENTPVNIDPGRFEARLTEMNQQLGDFFRRATRELGVNCWYMDNEESVAMWRGYAGLTTGVAVKSTYRRLGAAFQGEQTVWIGTVRYVDPNAESIQLGQVLHALVHKRKDFEYERELRALTKLPDTSDQPERGLGLAVPVDLHALIDSIVVGPDQDEWFFQAVKKTVEALAPQVPVRRSDLDTDPIF